jgi:hypothetical protein
MTTLEPVQEPPKFSPGTEAAGPYDPEMKAANPDARKPTEIPFWR